MSGHSMSSLFGSKNIAVGVSIMDAKRASGRNVSQAKELINMGYLDPKDSNSGAKVLRAEMKYLESTALR